MVVAESLAIFALAKKTVELVSSAVDTAENATSLYQGLDRLFHVKDQVSKHINKKPKKSKSKLRSFFNQTTQEDEEDELSVGSVAAMVLEQKKLDRKILNLSIKIDNKFGTGTWDEIISTRERLLKERAEKDKEQKKSAKRKEIEEKEFWAKIAHYFIEFFKLIFILACAYGIGWLIWINRCTEGNCQ
jgi:hypothetical protein